MGETGSARPSEPVIAGHEFAGTVAELGQGAGELHGVQVGDHVVAEHIIPCRRCRFCRSGHSWMCEPHVIFGFKRLRGEGAMAEWMIYPANALVHKVHARRTTGSACSASRPPSTGTWWAIRRS
jgi:L-iditol 2-dehydrogenase